MSLSLSFLELNCLNNSQNKKTKSQAIQYKEIESFWVTSAIPFHWSMPYSKIGFSFIFLNPESVHVNHSKINFKKFTLISVYSVTIRKWESPRRIIKTNLIQLTFQFSTERPIFKIFTISESAWQNHTFLSEVHQCQITFEQKNISRVSSAWLKTWKSEIRWKISNVFPTARFNFSKTPIHMLRNSLKKLKIIIH
jgi:hypothetical protein